MIAKVVSYGIQGVSGYAVQVEADITLLRQPGAAASFDIVGLPDASVKESRERVRAAIVNSAFAYPDQRITVNLAPADTRKIGPIYDLPIAVCLLAALGHVPQQALEGTALLGELSLNGEVRPVQGALPMTLAARSDGLQRILLPADNGPESACVEGIDVVAVESLSDVVAYLQGDKDIPPLERTQWQQEAEQGGDSCDFKYIRGQYMAKRALEIAAAGGHNVLMAGPPGSGKTMLARAFPTILPPLSYEESLETTNIHSIAGELAAGGGLLKRRPFLSPHHTASAVSVIGGGPNLTPGAVSRALNGVLFLDELPLWPRRILDALRQPLEDGIVTISRARGTVTYPARFILLAAMNPCPCGNHGTSRPCRCTPNQIETYLSHISGPVLDRIDIQLELEDVPFSDLVSRREAEPSQAVRERVTRARAIQLQRYQGSAAFCNAQMNQRELARFCPIRPRDLAMAQAFFEKEQATARALNRMIRVARTIADLDASTDIETEHLAEAFQYHLPAGKYWRRA